MRSESLREKGSTVDAVFDVMRVFQSLGCVQIAWLGTWLRSEYLGRIYSMFS